MNPNGIIWCFVTDNITAEEFYGKSKSRAATGRRRRRRAIDPLLRGEDLVFMRHMKGRSRQFPLAVSESML